MNIEEQIDRAYLEGMKAGWNCAFVGASSEFFSGEVDFDMTQYQSLVRARRNQIIEAAKERTPR